MFQRQAKRPPSPALTRRVGVTLTRSVSEGRQLDSKQHRRGLTLMEVIVALSIFLMSMAAIGNLLHIGFARNVEAQQQGVGLIKCQSKMSEVLCGSQTLSSQKGVFDEDKNWEWSVDVTPQQEANLYQVKVTVNRANGDGPKIEVSLTQMVFDPQWRGVNNGT
jgi:general secretion pathway protein I